jgi:hypothetical protein
MEFQATLNFVKEFVVSHDFVEDESFFLESLKSSLSSDGFILKRVHYLRGLEALEEPGDPEFTTNIILVFICVLCAGFASGLTQVSIRKVFKNNFPFLFY